MSRGVVYDPVCSGGATKVTQPPLVKASAVVFDAVCAILSGTQAATPPVVPTG